MADGLVVANLQRRRDLAVRAGDWNLVREFDFELARYGFRVVPPQAEDGVATYERAVIPPVAKRGPGRPRKDAHAGPSDG